MIKTIFFDCDGVLTLNEDGYALMSQNLAKVSWVDYMTIMDALTNYRHDLALWTLEFDWCWDEFCSKSWVKVTLEEFYADIVPAISKNEEMFEIARQLKKQGFTLGIITNNPKKRFEIISDLRGLSHTFETIALPSDVEGLKSGSEIFEFALESAWSLAEESLFIDNKAKNLLVPKELGMQIYHFDTYDSDTDALKQFLATQWINVN